MKIFVFLIVALSVSSCNKEIYKKSDISMRKSYLALGDSYTIGESVSQNQSFPFQLAAKLNLAGIKMSPPEIIATTGWTTDDLISAIEEKGLQNKYDLVTLLIGVNNQYRGYSKENYRVEFKGLLQTALDYADGNKERVFVVSIPDWGVTPYAQKSNRGVAKISAEIDAFNAVNKEEALKAGVAYVDITPGSKKAATDLSLLAEDGLHPSGKMYAEWAKGLATEIQNSNKF
jgi:lysophospholipase L1-like esterase